MALMFIVILGGRDRDSTYGLELTWFKLSTSTNRESMQAFLLACQGVGQEGKNEWWVQEVISSKTSKIESDSSNTCKH